MLVDRAGRAPSGTDMAMSNTSAQPERMYVIKLLITVGLVVYLLYSCNLSLLLLTLSNVDFRFACLAFVAALCLVLVGALNLWMLMNSICPIPLRLFIYSYGYGYAANLFAPGQLGDISLTLILKKYGIYYSHSTLAYAIDKIISLILILLIGCIGTKLLLPNFEQPIWIFAIPLICLIMAIICVLGIVYIPYDIWQIGRIRQFILNVYKESLLWESKVTAVLINIILTSVKWIILSIMYYLAFRTFGVEAKWPEVGIIPVIATLIGYIPISFAGIGTVELCAVYLFSLISIDRVYVIDVYILLRFIAYAQAGLILGLCNWQFKRARIL